MPKNANLSLSVAEVSLVLHATEDTDKVLRAIQDALYVVSDRFLSSSSEGHYKNRILLLRANLSGQEAAELAGRIVSLLSSVDREHLSSYIHEYSDEKGNLYLRLDKQRLCQGMVSLSESNGIRIRFRPVKRRFKPSTSIEILRDVLETNLST